MSVRIHKEFVSPNGREKVELFGPRDGLFGFRLWERKRKVWRQVRDLCEFRNYTSAVFEAGEQTDWMRWHPAFHLEGSRGLAFKRVNCAEEPWGEHRCIGCWTRMENLDWSDGQFDGFTAHWPIPHADGKGVGVWICQKCFAERQSDMQWRVED
jgi:hypothetical protein